MRLRQLATQRWISFPVLLVACLVAAWAGYLAGSNRSFSRIPFYYLGQTLTAQSQAAAFENWMLVEDAWLRSPGPRSAVFIRPYRVPAAPLTATFRLRSPARAQRVDVSLNGSSLGTLDVDTTAGDYRLDLPAGALRALSDNEFTLAPQAPSGASSGGSAALDLQSLRIMLAAGPAQGA